MANDGERNVRPGWYIVFKGTRQPGYKPWNCCATREEAQAKLNTAGLGLDRFEIVEVKLRHYGEEKQKCGSNPQA